MIKLDDLISLDKHPAIDPAACNTVFDSVDKNNNRQRILEADGRFFYYETSGDNVTAYFEIAVAWKPFPGTTIYAYTPDNRHIYEFHVRNHISRYVMKLNEEQVRPGDTCQFDNMTLEYQDESHLILNGKRIPIKQDTEYTYSLRRSMICAAGAAAGLYVFLEHIAEQEKAGILPLFYDTWHKIAKKYHATPDSGKEAAA